MSRYSWEVLIGLPYHQIQFPQARDILLLLLVLRLLLLLLLLLLMMSTTTDDVGKR